MYRKLWVSGSYILERSRHKNQLQTWGKQSPSTENLLLFSWLERAFPVGVSDQDKNVD